METGALLPLFLLSINSFQSTLFNQFALTLSLTSHEAGSLVARFIDELIVFDPRHHGAQLLAHHLNGMLSHHSTT